MSGDTWRVQWTGARAEGVADALVWALENSGGVFIRELPMPERATR